MKMQFYRKNIFARRDFLKLLGLGAALGAASCAQAGGDLFFESLGLGARAGRRGRLYGAAAQGAHLDDAPFAAALRRECAGLVPEAGLKWRALRPSPAEFDFAGYRRLAAFAEKHGLAVRGHVLVWHRANPPWLAAALERPDAAEKILEGHIRPVLRETAPLIKEWDVVNEAVHPLSTRADGLRPSPWLKALGPSYVPLAFHMARAAGPELTLVYNDYGMEYGDENGRRRRRDILRLLERLKKEGAPVHALGLQSHLQAGRPLGGRAFTDFLSEARGMGLALHVTELDLDLSRLRGRTGDVIRLGQNTLAAYLDALRRDGPVPVLFTWGLSSRHSWLNAVPGKNAQGALPLDDALARGAFWRTLRRHWAEA